MPLPWEVPVVQAPLAGGPSTPALTAAVTAAGGFGFVAGGYLSSDRLRDAIDETRALTPAPFGVNLFVPSRPGDRSRVDAYARALEPEADMLGVELGQPHWDDDAYEAKLEAVRAADVALVSFTFGCPTTEIIDELHRADVRVGVTVTSVPEAELATAVGADVLLVQGTEAGGHQGSFLDLAPNTTALPSLLAEVRETTGLPLVGAGGIMTGADASAVISAGAAAVAVGTALLCTDEAGTAAPYRRALLDGTYRDTIVTRAYTGRFARGLANRFAFDHDGEAPEAYPEVHHLTRPLRAKAMAVGDTTVPNLWAGTGWRRVTAGRAADVVAHRLPHATVDTLNDRAWSGR